MLPLLLVSVLYAMQVAIASPGMLDTRQTTPTLSFPPFWNIAPLGCFADSPERTLSGASFVDPVNMTVEACVGFCDSKGFAFAGVEFGEECYCDNAFNLAVQTRPATDCNQPCAGNPVEICGAPFRVLIYSSNNPRPFPTQAAGTNGWQSQGCFIDSIDLRTLTIRLDVPSLTVEVCTSTCLSNGFIFAGVEFGQECWCGNAILNNATAIPAPIDGITPGNPPVRPHAFGSTQTFCDMPCPGFNRQLCGGNNRMNLYKFTGTTPGIAMPPDTITRGCVTTANAHAAGSEFPGIVSAETCISACLTHGPDFRTYGLTEGNQCVCAADGIVGVSLPAAPPTLPAASCNLTCTTSPRELCGGEGAVQLYHFENLTPVLRALAAPLVTGNAVLALIQSATATNVATVATQITPAIGIFLAEAATALSQVASATRSGNDILTTTFAAQIQGPLINFANIYSGIINSLGNQSAILKPGSKTQMVAQINAVATDGISWVRTFGTEYVVAQETAALSIQTTLESAQTAALAKYN